MNSDINPQTIAAAPERTLSLVRLSIVFLVIGALTYAGSQSVATWDKIEVVESYQPWFAAYVDVTSTPAYSFEKRASVNDTRDVVLSFVVADTKSPCTPSWGGYYTMKEAAESLDLDRRIARLQQQGGKIAISFGGALNSELALVCEDPEALFLAYKSVVERYNISTIDLDLENENVRTVDALKRRAQAIAKLQTEFRDTGKNIVIWVTLPVAPQGLTKEGTDAVASFLAEKVDLAGVNLMTMDYGDSRDDSQSMFAASKSALLATHRQLGILYKQAGINLNSSSVWGKIGVTPMIGQNDVFDEIFTPEDATALNMFAREQGVARMSMWSANRDIPCGENYVDVKVVSDVCSGVSAPANVYTNALREGFQGDLMQQTKMMVEETETRVQIEDDPKTSPYQIWRDTGIYIKDTKVVWRGNVYEAKWWTKNDLPDNPVLQAWETPWQLIGPVLSTDKPMEKIVLPARSFPQWSGRLMYDAGDRVVFEGAAFRAKWWNQGESPAASGPNPESSPWIPLSDEQIKEIIAYRD